MLLLFESRYKNASLSELYATQRPFIAETSNAFSLFASNVNDIWTQALSLPNLTKPHMPLQASKTPPLGRYNDDVPFVKVSRRNVQGAPEPKPVFTNSDLSFPFQINVFVAMLLELAALDFVLLLDVVVAFVLLLDLVVVDFTLLLDFAVVDFTLLLDFVVVDFALLDFASSKVLPSNPTATIVSPLSTDAFFSIAKAMVFASFLINE